MPDRQRTVGRTSSELRGPALHSGAAGSIVIGPLGPGSGLVFERADLPGRPRIPARVSNVSSTRRCTALATGCAGISTVEHVLAACFICGVDNALLVVEGNELPAGDGSALPFVELIESAGIVEQGAPRRTATLDSEITAANGGARITARPASGPSFKFKFKGGGSLDGREVRFVPGVTDPRDVLCARTFCFEDEIDAIRAAGMGRGGNAENVVVLRRDGSSVNAVRCEGEPARHKLLDFIGDLSLAGVRVCAEFTAEGSGHAHNTEFARLLEERILRNGGQVVTC